MKRHLIASAIAVAFGVAAPAFADDPPAAAAAAPAPPAPKVKVERSASGQKIYKIETGIVVEGRVQKPNAFYVLQRSSIDYDFESLKQDFLPKIIDATSKNPF